MTAYGAWRRMIGAVAAIGVLAWPAIATADMRSFRLSPVRLRPGPIDLPIASGRKPPAFLGMLSATDRFDLGESRSGAAEVDLGDMALDVLAGHAGGIPRSRSAGALAGDHWSTRFLGTRATLPLGSRLSIDVHGDLMLMTRRLGVMPVYARRLGSTLAQAGVGAAIDGRLRILLDYVAISRPGGHDRITRLAETMGGAPLPGHGPQLVLALPPDLPSGGLGWSLSLSTMRRPEGDLWLGDARGERLDNRAMSTIGLRF